MASKLVANIRFTLIIMGPIIIIYLIFVNLFSAGNSNKNVQSETTLAEQNGIVFNTKNIANTQEKRLEIYKLVSAIDPILSIPEQINQINEYSETQKNIEKLEKYNKKIGINTTIFPVNFFREYISLIEKQANFFDLGNTESALSYQNQLEKTIQAYSDEIRNHENFAELTFSGQMEKKIYNVTGTSVITPIIITSDLKILLTNAAVLTSIIQERKQCLENDVNLCKLYTGNIYSSEAGPKNITSTTLINNKLTWLSTDNWCGEKQNKNTVLTFDISCQKSLGFCSNNNEIIGEKYYKGILPNLPYETLLYNNGARFSPLSVTAPYMCYDNGYKGILGNLQFFLSYIKTNKLTNDIKSQRLEEIQQKEKFLIGNNGSDEDEIHALIKEYVDYIRLYSTSLSTVEGKKILTRYRLLQGNFMNNYLSYNEEIHHLLNYFVVNTIINKKVNTDDLVLYLATVRSDYSFNYLIFSPFVWRTENHPQYSTKAIIPTNIKKVMILNESEAEKLYGKTTVEKWTELFDLNNKTDFYSQYYKQLGF